MDLMTLRTSVGRGQIRREDEGGAAMRGNVSAVISIPLGILYDSSRYASKRKVLDMWH